MRFSFEKHIHSLSQSFFKLQNTKEFDSNRRNIFKGLNSDPPIIKWDENCWDDTPLSPGGQVREPGPVFTKIIILRINLIFRTFLTIVVFSQKSSKNINFPIHKWSFLESHIFLEFS